MSQLKEVVKRLGIKSDSSYASKDSGMFHCCYHDDWSPSLSINFKTAGFHCFQCGRSGSINKLSLYISSRSIGQVLGISDDLDSLIPFNNPLNDATDNLDASIAIVNPVDIRGKLINWRQSEEAIEYINRRGITSNVADSMDMKYAHEVRINGTLFKNRVCIPIYDTNGDIINIEGRDIDRNSSLKCLYPRNSTKPIFEWYKLDTSNPLYLFEGLIKMAVARTDKYFNNSSTTLGSKISEYQMNQLNMFDTIVHCPDNDEAGEDQLHRLRKSYKGKLQVLRLGNLDIKDVDEIPTKLGMTVYEFRMNNGFLLDIEYL